MDVQQIIHEQVTTHPVVLYMKGSPAMPRCGFSATAPVWSPATGTIPGIAGNHPPLATLAALRRLHETKEEEA